MPKESKKRRSKKEKKSKKRRHRDDDSASGSSEDDVVDERLERRVQKVAESRAKHLAKRLRSKGGIAGYTDSDNPFGDSNLTERFVWGKKIQKEVREGKSEKDFSLRSQRDTLDARMAEIERVKQRREAREREAEELEAELARVNRERAMLEFADDEARQERFLLEQTRRRATIRVTEGRARALDKVAQNLECDEHFDPETDPEAVFRGLTARETESLHEDIKAFGQLDASHKQRSRFWNALLQLCEHEMNTSQRLVFHAQEGTSMATDTERSRVHAQVDADIEDILLGKNSIQLQEMADKIESDLQSSSLKEVEYWEEVLSRLKIAEAQQFVREYFQDLVSAAKLKFPEKFIAKDEEDSEVEDTEVKDAVAMVDTFRGPNSNMEFIEPEPKHFVTKRPGEVIVSESQDRKEIEALRQQAKQEVNRAAGPPSAEGALLGSQAESEDGFQREAMKKMGSVQPGDAQFRGEVALEGQKFWWHDKYRPRKPKFFNRVHTAYDWNKYNQTHYDHDNPPPKVVVGYMFNIFYPDLIDKSKTPTFRISHDLDSKNGETCIIRFSAGPPYEDIAFRIVNKEWEYTHKKGYRCTFDRGIMHLYFNFKRFRYRR